MILRFVVDTSNLMGMNKKWDVNSINVAEDRNKLWTSVTIANIAPVP